jgi:hypothetical protein
VYAEIVAIPFLSCFRNGDREAPKGGLSLTTRWYYLCIVSSPCLNSFFSLCEGSSDSSFDSLSDLQAARETCCETKRETVREEIFTSPEDGHGDEEEFGKPSVIVFWKGSPSYTVHEDSIQTRDSLLGRQELARTTSACSQMAL